MWNRTENQINAQIALIRHGKTASNREHRYLGRTDEGLDTDGKQELLKYKEEGRYPVVDVLFVSPMKRCKETAEILYPGVPYLEIPEWCEMDFGEFEGKDYMELSDDPRYQAWIDSNGTFPFPGGESREDFICRCVQGYKKMEKKLSEMQRNNPDQTLDIDCGTQMSSRPLTIGCIVHGGTIMALLSHYLGGEYFDYQIPNGVIYMWVPSGSAVG